MESPPTTIADIVRIKALAAPDALAILAPGRAPLAFGALARAIDATIQSLARAGFGRGDRVALALPEGPEMAVAVLSVSGCATCMVAAASSATVGSLKSSRMGTSTFQCARIRDRS